MTTLLWFTIRQVLADRKVWVTVLLLASPAALALLVRVGDFGSTPTAYWELFHGAMLMLLLGVVIPIVCMLHGTALITSEVESRTLVYLITRRLRRGTVFLVRFFAMSVLLTLFSQAATILLYGVALGGVEGLAETSIPAGGPIGEVFVYLQHLPVAVVGYLAVFTLFGVIFPRPVAASMFLIFVWETLVGNRTLGLRSYTLSHQIRLDLVKQNPGLLEILPLGEEGPRLFPAGATGLDNLLAIIVVALVLTFLVVTKRELVAARVARE